MAKDSAKLKDNQCPKCNFAGINSDGTKFSAEKINQFPKGYAPEKHPQIIIIKKSGQEIQEFVTKNKQIIFNEISRCPVCGYVEGDEL